MEEAINAVKEFILENANAFTTKGLVAPVVEDIVIGEVDTQKNLRPLVVSIIGETENEYEDNRLDGVSEQSDLIITFICRGKTIDKLQTDAMRYAETFRRLVIAHSTLDGKVEGSGIGTRTFYLDCGVVQQQMAAVEINLSVVTSVEL